METITAVWIVVLHFTLMSYSGDALPERPHRIAYAEETDCKKAVTSVHRSIARKRLPLEPDWVACIKIEVKP